MLSKRFTQLTQLKRSEKMTFSDNRTGYLLLFLFDVLMSDLTSIPCRQRLLRFSYHHDILILAKPSKSKCSPTKVKLNTHQLALTKLLQRGVHQTGMVEVPMSTYRE